MNPFVRTSALVLAVTAVLTLVPSCGGGGGGGGGGAIQMSCEFLSPTQDIVLAPGASLEIRYIDRDLDGVNNARTSLYAVPAQKPSETIRLVDGKINGGGTVKSYVWHTTGVDTGPYRIEARMNDGDDELTVEASGTVTISDLPIHIVNPTDTPTVSRGGYVALTFTAAFPGQVLISLFSDRDGRLETDTDRIPISSNLPDANGAPQVAIWDATNAPVGIHRFFATLSGAIEPTTVKFPLVAYVSNTACAAQFGTADQDLGALAGAFPDGSAIVAGSWNAPPGNPLHAFVAKMSANCTRSWAKGAENETAGSAFDRMLTWSDGTFFLAGNMASQGDLGVGETNATTLAAGRFWAKFNADGTLSWAMPVPLPAGANLDDVAALPSGGLVAVGHFTGSVLFNVGATARTLTSLGANDLFVAGYDSGGNMTWLQHAGGPANDSAHDVETLPNGDAMVLGSFANQITFGPNNPNPPVLTADTLVAVDSFVARYGNGGTLAWAKHGQVPIVGTPAGGDLILGTYPDGTFVVVGTMSQDEEFSLATAQRQTVPTAGPTMFVARFNSGADLLWANATSDGNGTIRPTDIATLDDGSVVIVGDVTGNVLYGPGSRAERALTTGGFRTRWMSAGFAAWAFQSEVYGASGLSVAGFPGGRFVVSSEISTSVTLGAGTAKVKTLSPPTGNAWDSDAVLIQYNADGGF